MTFMFGLEDEQRGARRRAVIPHVGLRVASRRLDPVGLSRTRANESTSSPKQRSPALDLWPWRSNTAAARRSARPGPLTVWARWPFSRKRHGCSFPAPCTASCTARPASSYPPCVDVLVRQSAVSTLTVSQKTASRPEPRGS